MVLEELSRAGLGPDGPAFWLLIAGVLFALLFFAWGIALSRGTTNKVAKIDELLRSDSGRNREESERRARELREELRGQIGEVAESLRNGLETSRKTLEDNIRAGSAQQLESSTALRGEINAAVKLFGDGLKQDVEGLSRTLKERFSDFSHNLSDRQATFEKAVGEKLAATTETVSALARSNSEAQSQLKAAVEERLEKLRSDNETKLEQMRLTVDEKLQSTLEKRLGDSFKLVSERLEHVHRGLGEMQSLAAGVGDLKKVLTNVKDRGGWAEIQLGALLDQMLARDQYVTNARIDPTSQYAVEFAVRFPGFDQGNDVLLPIDSKFPKEDYERLMAAWESGESELAKSSLDALERIIDSEAKKISEKYIRPPYSTDFAILFLPTEGLFAETIRRPGLSTRIQSKYKVTVAGPTTLAALLTSLQMGFRTLAIQKRSSEVWEVLAQAKQEFEQYAQVWEKLGKQLETAQNTVHQAGVRTRAVARKLQKVESVDATVIDSPSNALSIEFTEDDDL